MNAPHDAATQLLQRRLATARAAAALRTLVESLCLGVTAGCAALAGLLLANPGAEPALVAALPAGLAAAGAWWLERRSSQRALVRRVDRALELDGALLAWSERGELSPLAPLLAARLAPRVPFGRALAAACATTPLFLALPCGALGLTAWLGARSVETPGAPAALQSSAGAAGAARGLSAALAREAAELPDELPAELRRRAEQLARAAAALESGPARAERSEQAAQLADAAQSLAAELQTTPELEQAVRGLERELRSAGAAPAALAGGDPLASVPPTPAAPSPSSPSGAPPSPLPDAIPTSGPAGPGTIADNPWWAPRYDALVQAWLAERRRP